ncbi:MAG: YihY/virulence factor BrkB family protein [Deltaproteobacteria bacterium]|nr:YihY/virulence factor BrkB family protein [Deltaproteobacteria bacterium]
METEPETQPSVGEVIAGRPRTVPKARTGSKPVRFAKQLGKSLWDDNIPDVAAMMAYYAVLALFPMIVFIVTIALLVIDPVAIHQGVLMVTEAMPESSRDFISKQVTNLIDAADAGFAIGSAVFALWGASRGAAALGCALNTIYNKQETRGFFYRQLIAIAMTVVVAVLMVVALGLLVVGPAAGHLIADRFGLGEQFDIAWGLGRWVGAGLLVMFVWALLYKFLSNSEAPFRVFTPGALAGVVLWLAISALFGLYLAHFNTYDATYGALGGAIIFLTWLWLSNMALLFGAEVNDVLADFRKHDDDAAAELARPDR